MSSTRNFEFRDAPEGAQRDGGWISPAAVTLVIGAPVKVNTAVVDTEFGGVLTAQLATGPQAPQPGLSGIAVYEYKGADGWAGDDPYLTTYSDKDTVPRGELFQVVSGDTVRVAFRNTNAVTFLNNRDYTARTMVAESAGATPNVDVGSYLSPGVGNDTAGYWSVTTVAANAWLVVTKVDDATGEVEARMLF